MKRKIIVLLGALMFILAACGSGKISVEATPTPYPTPVRQTFTVQRGELVWDTKLPGKVTPQAMYTVFFQMAGQVREVLANVNDVVKEGQTLGELDKAQELRAKVNEMKRTIRRAQIDLEIEKLTLDQFTAQNRPAYEQEIQKRKVELAQLNFDELMESLGIDPNASFSEELDAQVIQSKAFAPADGTIISAVTVGRNVTPTTPAFVLGDPNKLEVVADPAPGDDLIKEMFEGMPVTVIVDGRDGVELSGKISQLPSPYGTGPSDPHVIHILLDATPSDTTYQSGDKVTVKLVLASKDGVLWLPPDAIRSVGGRTFVIVNSASGPKRVDIEIGLQNRDMVEIVSGLSEGDEVVAP